MHVEITSVDGSVDTNKRADGSVNFSQKAYLHTDAAYPLPFKLSLASQADAYGVGKYKLSAGAFKTGQYGDLEINRYQMRLEKLDK
jgi:hypothetical protein